MRAEPPPVDPDALQAQRAGMRRLARSLVGDYDRADDVVQEACLRALTGSVRPRSSLGACLAGVVRNVARKVHRSERRRALRERGAARPEPQPSTVELLARLDTQRKVLTCVRELQEPFRTAVLLRHIEGLPPREIARRLGVPVETVKSRLKRGLARLRASLDAAHGGRRRAWLAALLPVAGLTPLASASITKVGGQLMSQTAGMKTAAVVVAALLLAGAALLYGGMFESNEPQGGPPTELTAQRDRPELAGRGGPPGALEAAGGARTPAQPGEISAGSAPGEAAHDGEAVAARPRTGAADAEGGGDEAKPAVRRSPFGLPKRQPGSRILPGGSGPGPGGPTGHWTRFGIMPKSKGTARIAVTVVDEDGHPVVGADVYLGPPDTAGVNGISFGDLRRIGKTGADGLLVAEDLPDGAAAVFGNINNRLNGRFGLDGRHGVKTTLRAGARVAAKVQLPFSTAKLGTVSGSVIGPEGQPLPASVAIGFAQMWTKRDGVFSLQGIPEGKTALLARATGFRPATVDVEVAAGRTTEIEVKLEYAESGTMRIEGVVVGPQDEAVAGAHVYLMLEKSRGTLRSTLTDEQGRFTMERLPERVRSEAARLQASRAPYYATRLLRFETGITDERVTLQLPIRYVQLRLRVVDAETNEPVGQLVATAERPESRQRVSRLIYDRAQGVRQGMLEPGRHTVRIDALDHEDMEFELDVTPDAQGNFTHQVSLKRVSSPSVQVALTIALTDAVSGAPVARARLEVLEVDGGQPLSRFEGGRADGEYRMPAPSGKRRLAITAEGYERYAAPLELEPGEPEVRLEIQLQPQ